MLHTGNTSMGTLATQMFVKTVFAFKALRTVTISILNSFISFYLLLDSIFKRRLI